MDCQEVKSILSGYLDQVLDQMEEEKVREHLKSCAGCQEELAALKMVISELQNSAEISAPSDFSRSIRARLEAKPVNSSKKKIAGIFKKSLAVAAVFVLLAIAAPFLTKQQSMDLAINKEMSSAQSESKGDQAWTFADGANEGGGRAKIASVNPPEGMDSNMANENREIPAVQPEEATNTTVQRASDSVVTRKVITEGYVQLKVQSLKDVSDKITLLVDTVGGFIQSSAYNESHQGYASLVLRIPTEDYQKVFDQVQKLGKLEAKETNGQDVTMKSVDLEARLKTLQTQEERLLNLLEKGKNLDEILKIETEMQRVREEIETVTAELKALNDLVDLATLRVELYQNELVPVTASSLETSGFKGIFKRAYNALIESINQLVSFLGLAIVFIGGAIPYLLLLAIGVTVYYWIRRRYFKTGR